MLLIFGDGTAYCKCINVLPLRAKPTHLCPALWHWIWTISSLPVGTMLRFVSRGSQRDINWIRGYLLCFWVLCSFSGMLGCQECTGHLVALTLPAPHGGHFSDSFSSTPAGRIPTSLADTPLGGSPVNFLSTPASVSEAPLTPPSHWHPPPTPQRMSCWFAPDCDSNEPQPRPPTGAGSQP